ncbi:hypothetical protein ACFUJR_26550 [Streptomyces sp. NPDC057271]|uniref:hypothetical protein n=1 Tax=Streptomyces sp. NPDC057271 TaxID=3346078 RepID=UPI0036329B49
MPDAVRLGVLDACVFHGGFPADALLTGCFDLVETSAFGGFAAKRDLLCDLGELVFEGASGGVGPFVRPVWLAAAEDAAEAFGWGVVEAGDPDPEFFLASASSFLVATCSVRSCSWRMRNSVVWPCAVVVKWGDDDGGVDVVAAADDQVLRVAA